MEDVKDDLKRAVEILRSGGVILYPADSGWGLGCDATNKNAVEKIVRIKKSEAKNTMIVLLDNASRLQAYVNEVPDMAWDLIDLTEKPLTILFENAKNLPDNVVSVDKSVAIRVTNEYFSNSLCSRFRNAILFTPAHVSGEPVPESFSEISDEIKSDVDYIVAFRRDERIGRDISSVIKLGKGNVIQVIRQ